MCSKHNYGRVTGSTSLLVPHDMLQEGQGWKGQGLPAAAPHEQRENPIVPGSMQCKYVHACRHHRHNKPMAAWTDKGPCLCDHSWWQALQVDKCRQQLM
jgi:hypothetical protein